MIFSGFPPLSGSGTQRKLKFVKYLSLFGWQCIILTTKEPVGANYDYSLMEEIPHDVNIFKSETFSVVNIINLLRKSCGKKTTPKVGYDKNEKNSGPIDLIKRFLNNYVLIPDDLISWLPVSLIHAVRIVKKYRIDVIYTSSPSPVCHLAGLLLKKVEKLPLVLDFRDHWIENPMRPIYPNIRNKIEKLMEYHVIKNANKVILATESIEKDMRKKYASLNPSKFCTITNGYDEEDYKNLFIKKKNDKFTLSYVGSFYAKQSPIYFLRAAKKLLEEKPWISNKTEILFIGSFGKENERIVKELGLEGVVKIVGYVSHKQSIQYLKKSDALLLVIFSGKGDSGIYTGKIFEYLAAQKPILALVPDGIAANLILKSRAGVVVPPEDINAIKNAIYDMFSQYNKGILKIAPDLSIIKKFERKKLTRNLANIFNDLLNNKEIVRE